MCYIISTKLSHKKLDNNDTKIIQLMLEGKNNREISKLLSIPLSTIQRRARHIFASGIITSRIELDYEKLGYKTGLLHI
ncbi:MAG: hypothetical protein DA329_03785 [Candidatus Nitrosocosmicus sp.]|nr:hypothetical protein [Candidatus Nitrosocosmicus sp.]